MPTLTHGSAAGAVALPTPRGRVERTQHTHLRYLCPRCSSLALRKSHASSLLEVILELGRVEPYRCRRCYHRFHLFSPALRYICK